MNQILNLNTPTSTTSQNIFHDDDEEFLATYSDETFFFEEDNENNDVNNNKTLEESINVITSDQDSDFSNDETICLAPLTAPNACFVEQKLVVLLKQAKGKDDQFESHFPPSLLCHPYKYDLKIIGKIENHHQHKLILNLVDAETLIVPSVTLPNKKIIEAVAVEQIEELNANERIIRFTFNLCSFHFKRRPFKLELTQNINGSSKRLFLSDPFQTFARRRDHHQSFGSIVKNPAATTTSAPLTPESNSNSNISSVNSPKSDKQGVKRSISSVSSSHYPVNKTRNLAPSSPISPRVQLNPSVAVPHYTAGGYPPYMFSANFAVAAAAYHQEMAQQYASMPFAQKMPVYYPQWSSYPTNHPMVFGSPNTSPVSPPSNVIAHNERSHDVLGALIGDNTTDKTKQAKKTTEKHIIHHTPLNFVQPSQATSPVVESSERASLAIQLFQTLSPMERQTVSLFINGSSPNV